MVYDTMIKGTSLKSMLQQNNSNNNNTKFKRVMNTFGFKLQFLKLKL